MASTTTLTAAESDDMRRQKQALRKEIRQRLRDLSSDEVETQSNQVWERLFCLPEYQEARTVGLFLSMPQHEIKTEAALRHCVENGKIIYVPQVGKNFEQADMELLKVILPEADHPSNDIFYHSWPRNKWGIPEPPASMPQEVAQPGDIDLIVVPGLGFDRRGNRIGQGKGYYDRFIARMMTGNAKHPKLVAVALQCQLVEDIPVSPLDCVMHKVLVPSETIQVSTT